MKISKHYTENIATRFLRPLFAQIFADSTLNRRIADLTEHSNDFVIQGFHLEELYFNIIAMSQFIFFTKRDILPNIHTLRDDNLKNSGNDKVYRAMAFNNLPANINILVQDVKLLYESALKYDEANSPRNRKVSAAIPELASIEKMLNEK